MVGKRVVRIFVEFGTGLTARFYPPTRPEGTGAMQVTHSSTHLQFGICNTLFNPAEHRDQTIDERMDVL